MRKVLAALAVSLVAVGVVVGFALALPGDELDPARNLVVPCEVVNAGGTVPRSSNKLQHLANICGFVGTDIEFQSRTDATGKVHDFAFVGTMGGGPRIFDITDPAHPTPAGAYADSGWENDVQVRGDYLVNTFDGVDGEPSSASLCLQQAAPGTAAGIDILRLNYNPQTATFAPSLVDCVADPPGGAHNVTIAPSGEFLAISNCCSDWAIDLVDLTQLGLGTATHTLRLIDEGKKDAARCPAAGVTFQCVVIHKPDGSSAKDLWRPHDVFFSPDSSVMYVAAINSTWIVRVKPSIQPLAYIPNNLEPPPPGETDPQLNPKNVAISHQADTTSDGKILVISDERGGGLTETGCLPGQGGVLGGLHFFALAPIAGRPDTAAASLTNPVKLGDYFTPPPLLDVDPLNQALVDLRIERGCTIHVFRWGGNGSTSPGPIDPAHDGVSRLPLTQGTSAHYGAGTWWLDVYAPSSNTDGTPEDPRSTWGNTKGWIVMPGADTWSAKEYKGHIFAADMVRGFDVFSFVGGAPTNVTISSFTAKCATKGTTVAWRTAVENSLLGFNLFRVQGKKQTKVNKAIVPAKAVGRAGGAKYSFADKTAKKNTRYSYKLQIIDLTGAKRFVATTALKKKCVASPL